MCELLKCVLLVCRLVVVCYSGDRNVPPSWQQCHLLADERGLAHPVVGREDHEGKRQAEKERQLDRESGSER